MAGDAGELEPGLYVVDRSERVVARFDARPASVAATITGLTTRSAPLSGAGFLAPDALFVRVRLIELSTGRVVVRATAEGADPSILAADLARQLAAAAQPAGIVAVVPIRPVGQAGADTAEASSPLGHLLAESLTRRGWPRTLSPESTTQVLATLEITATEVEFDPSPLVNHVPWAAVLVGSVERRGDSAR